MITRLMHFVGAGSHQEGKIAVRDESRFLRWKTADPQAITWEEPSKRVSVV